MKIEEYMKSNTLDYPVLLTGRTVAKKQYYVAAFPAQFWLDSNGIVVARETGFDPADAEATAKRIERLLEARKESSGR